MGLFDKVKGIFDNENVSYVTNRKRNTCVDAAEEASKILKQEGIEGTKKTIGAEKGEVKHQLVVVEDGKQQIIIDSKAPKKKVMGKNGKPTGEERIDNTKRKRVVK